MKKQINNLSSILIFISLVIVTLSLIPLQSFLSQKNNTDTRSKAAGNSLTACTSGCQYSGAAGLQQAVDTASEGDIINISGTISGSSQFSPFSGSMNVKSCFVDLKGKSLTIKGGTLFGEGHDKGTHEDGDPLYHRAGICSKGGTVVIDGVHVKEFEGGGMQFFNANLIVNNSTIDGSDHGGIFLFDSSILALNNLFVSNIGFIPFRSSNIKAYNNIFWGKAIIAAVSCNDNVPPIDFVNNIVVDPELTIGIGGLSTNCPQKVSQFKDKHFAYNIQWKQGRNCYPHEYCDPYPGKIDADPSFKAPVVDPRGSAAWADWSLNEGSPAIGSADPSIPGPRNMGISGGPCADGNSPACNSFIEQHKEVIQEPTFTIPTSPPVNPPPDTIITQPAQIQPTQSNNNPPITYYLPPTMSFANPNSQNQPTGTTSNNGNINSPTPTITPTPKPIIDVAKTIESAKNSWNNFLTSIIQFTKTILP